MDQWRSPGASTEIYLVGMSDRHQLVTLRNLTATDSHIHLATMAVGPANYSFASGVVSNTVVGSASSYQYTSLRPVVDPAFLLGIPWIHRILELHSRVQIEASALPWLREYGVFDTIRAVQSEINSTPKLSSASARVYSYPDPDTGAFRCVSIAITVEGIEFDEMRTIEAGLRSKLRSLRPGCRVVVTILPP